MRTCFASSVVRRITLMVGHFFCLFPVKHDNLFPYFSSSTKLKLVACCCLSFLFFVFCRKYQIQRFGILVFVWILICSAIVLYCSYGMRAWKLENRQLCENSFILWRKRVGFGENAGVGVFDVGWIGEEREEIERHRRVNAERSER